MLFQVLLISGTAVLDVQCEEEGAEHTTLGGSGVKYRTCDYQLARKSNIQLETRAQSVKFSNQLNG